LPGGEGRLHAKLYQRLRDMIQHGHWPAGTRLPSSRVLADDLGLSRNTAAVAIDQLVAEGWAEARNRSGIYVARRLPRQKVQRSADTTPNPAPAVIPPQPIDLFPVREWRAIQSKLWTAKGAALLNAPPPLGEMELREAIADFVCAPRGFRPEPGRVVIAEEGESTINILAQLLGVSSHPAAAAAWIDISDNLPNGTRARAELLDDVSARNVWLVERDRHLWRDRGRRPTEPLRSASGADRVLYRCDLGDFLFPALPISFLVLPDALPLLQDDGAPLAGAPTRLDQLTLASFIRSGGFAAHLRRIRRSLDGRRSRVEQLLKHLTGRRAAQASAWSPYHLTLVCENQEGVAARLRRVGLAVELGDGGLHVGFGGLSDQHWQDLTERAAGF